MRNQSYRHLKGINIKYCKNNILLMAVLATAFAMLMSLPFLVPHTGILALLGFVPLLAMERIASYGDGSGIIGHLRYGMLLPHFGCALQP